MDNFSTLSTIANQINTESAIYPIGTVLQLLAKTKATCESYADFTYSKSTGSISTAKYDLRVCRDLCVAGLNAGNNKSSLDSRFQAVKALLSTYA